MKRRKQLIRMRDMPAHIEAHFGEPFDESRHSLWWVRPEMARLAVLAANDMPTDRAEVTAFPSPAPRGMMVWEGGTGLCTSSSGTKDFFEVQGLFWDATDFMRGGDTPLVAGLTVAEARIPVSPLQGLPDMAFETADRLWDLMTATLHLAHQPTLGRRSFRTRSGAETVQVDWRTMLPKPELPRSITVATLREVATSPEKWDHEDQDPKWRLTKRHIVRGHWRNQAHGPGRQQRRPVYVPTYIKGPDGAPMLDQTPLVHIWRR